MKNKILKKINLLNKFFFKMFVNLLYRKKYKRYQQIILAKKLFKILIEKILHNMIINKVWGMINKFVWKKYPWMILILVLYKSLIILVKHARHNFIKIARFNLFN